MHLLDEQIIGNEPTRQYLQRLFDRDRVSGSYLFIGPAGLGKKLCARAFAEAVQCASTSGQRPCGACLSCREWSKGLHPDTLSIDLLADRSNILLEQIRPSRNADHPTELTVQHRLQLRPAVGRRQVVIIDQAEKLNLAAANALLKTLEEPRDKTIIILITETIATLPSTILSRCIPIHFQRVSAKSIHDALKFRFSLSTDQLRLIVKLSNGLPGRAITLAEQPAELKRWSELLEETLSALECVTTEPFRLSANVLPGESGAQRATLTDIQILLSLLLEDFIHLSTQTPLSSVPQMSAQRLRRLANRWPTSAFIQFGLQLSRLRRNVAHAVNPRTALDCLTNSLSIYAV